MSAVAKDWIAEAADKIYEGHDSSPVTIAQTIKSCCPLKPDTAYIPVPCCDTCRYWELEPTYVEPAGRCLIQDGGDGAKVWSDCGDYTIITSGDFGCVQWEARG